MCSSRAVEHPTNMTVDQKRNTCPSIRSLLPKLLNLYQLYKKTRRRKMAQLSAPRAATRKIVIRSRE
jgi:hypothetical protein